MVSETDGRFVGFVHSESNTSAEVFVTLLETLNHILEATVNKNVVRSHTRRSRIGVRPCAVPCQCHDFTLVASESRVRSGA